MKNETKGCCDKCLCKGHPRDEYGNSIGHDGNCHNPSCNCHTDNKPEEWEEKTISFVDSLFQTHLLNENKAARQMFLQHLEDYFLPKSQVKSVIEELMLDASDTLLGEGYKTALSDLASRLLGDNSKEE